MNIAVRMIGRQRPCNAATMVRTASNAYFPQVVSGLSLPDRGSAAETAVRDLWDDLQIVDGAADLACLKKKPKTAETLGRGCKIRYVKKKKP